MGAELSDAGRAVDDDLRQTAGRGGRLPLFLSGGGAAGALIGAYDWASTPIGEISKWPVSLKNSASLLLRSQVPIVLLWGEDGVMIYNDAYAVFAASRHPKLLGSKVRDGWPEVANFNDNVMRVGLEGGNLSYRDKELTLNRSGRPEQVWMNLDYSSVLGDDGTPAGVIAIVVETTAKVISQRWLLSERDRQRQMFEQAPGFTAMMFGPDHIFELTNAAYMQLVGHRNVLGKPVREALPEVAEQGFIELLDRVFTTGEPFTGSAMRAELHRAPDTPKEERFLDLIYQPVRDPNGEIIGIFAQGQDVTDRVRVERSLRQSEMRFRTLAEAIPNQVWTASAGGALDWFNSRVYEYSGFGHGDLDGDLWAKMVMPEDLPSSVARWQHSMTSGEAYETEFRLRRLDGAYRWHIARAVPIRDGEGDIVQWIGTNTDIDDQKRSIQALHESERRLQLSQKAAGIASLELDIDSGLVLGSDEFWNLWGLSPRESVHISVLEDIVIAEDGHIRSNPETRRQGTAIPTVEYRIRRADNGELRWLSRSVDFVHDADGKPIKMFGVMQDITQRKEAQVRQRLLTHELEHRIKNILSMVGAIASQTFRNTDIETARAAFSLRLKALAKAHDILNKTRWTKASIEQVVESTVAAFPPEQIAISGASVAINPKMALSLALAVNELATNAFKYGALSTQEGRVEISWTLDTDPIDPNAALIWRWREQGGPSVETPSRRGFGSLFVERVLSTDFGGRVRIEYRPEGVLCVLESPIPAMDMTTAQRDGREQH